MRTWCLLVFALIAGPVSAATVWRWVDENGVVHYSDRPVEGAEEIELTPAQSFPSTRQAPRRTLPQQSTQASVPYQSFEVVSPAQEETLWNIGGTLQVQLALQPALRPNHRIDVLLDGERKNLSSTSTQLTVPEVFRGQHSLQGVVVDADGREVQRTSAITFVVQQTSVLNPNNPTPPARNRP